MNRTALVTTATLPNTQPSIDLARLALEDHITMDYLLTHGQWRLEDIPVHDNDPRPYGDGGVTTGNRVSRKSFLVKYKGQSWRVPADPSPSGPPYLPVFTVQPPPMYGEKWTQVSTQCTFQCTLPALVQWQGWLKGIDGQFAWIPMRYAIKGLSSQNYFSFGVDKNGSDVPKCGLYRFQVGSASFIDLYDQVVETLVPGAGIQTVSSRVEFDCGIESGHKATTYNDVLIVRCVVSNAGIGGAAAASTQAGITLRDPSGTWFCTYAGLGRPQLAAMLHLRQWVHEHHPEDLVEYNLDAPGVVQGLGSNHQGMMLELLQPAVSLAVQGKFEAAWLTYSKMARDLKQTLDQGRIESPLQPG